MVFYSCVARHTYVHSDSFLTLLQHVHAGCRIKLLTAVCDSLLIRWVLWTQAVGSGCLSSAMLLADVED